VREELTKQMQKLLYLADILQEEGNEEIAKELLALHKEIARICKEVFND